MTLLPLILLTLINLFNYLDRYLVQALLPLISRDFNLNYEQSGLLAAAFVFGYFLTSPLFGVLGDRWHRPKLMAVGIVLWSLATIGGGLVEAYAIFFTLRILVGVGEASFGTILPGYIKDRLSNPLSVNRAFAVLYAAIPVGSALAYVLGGTIAAHASWHWAFFLGGVPGLVLAAWVVRQPEVRAARPQSSAHAPLREVRSDLKTLALIPVLWFAILGYALNSFALNAIATFVAHYGVSIGFSHEHITQVFGMILVGTGFAGTLCGGALCDRLVKKSTHPIRTMLWVVGISALAAVPFCALAFVTSDHTTFLVVCSVAEFLVFAGTAPINSILVLAAPKQLVTLVQGVSIFTLNAFGALLAPWCVGLVADSTSLPQALQLATVALFLCGVVWLWGTRYASSVEHSARNS